MKILENLWQSLETFGNFRKQFKSVCHRFYDFLKFSENLRVFGSLREFSENFGNSSKVIFRCSYGLLKFPEIFESVRKSSEIVGKLRKRLKSNFQMFYDFLKFSENLRKSSEVFGNLRKCSENFGNGSKVIFRCSYDFFKKF